MVNAQQYLEENYPVASRNNITELDLSNKNLEGSIRFNNSGFNNLLKLNISFNMITHIHYTLPSIQQVDVSHNLLSKSHSYATSTLRKFNCSFNNIVGYTLKAPSLTHFDGSNNLLSTLVITSHFIEELNCSNNPITSVPFNITSTLTSFDCMGVQFNKKSTTLSSLPSSATYIPTNPTIPTSNVISSTFPNSFDNPYLVIGLGIFSILNIFGWTTLGIIFLCKRKREKVILTPGSS
ncbi:726_t:CDS:1 [Cetraspora pellucida]|uniref:726_t:CDS:1 n=1 Tax=Cetraspora pellucida TaxID=1433469 RepID=A0A9N9GH02_9GLOM|nr:726_t:CDS:1 [Cetraspora pellucida]